MEKKYATGVKGIETLIEQRAVDKPFSLEIERFKSRSGFARHRVDAALASAQIVREFELESRSKRDHTMRRNGAMLAMIYDGIWDQELADFWEIKEKDLVHYYSMKLHMFLYMMSDVESEFRIHVNKEAIKRYAIEAEKAERYRKGIKGELSEYKVVPKKDGKLSVTDIILNVAHPALVYKRENNPPRLIIQEELWGSSNDEDPLVTLQGELENLKYQLKTYSTRSIDGKRVWTRNEEGITQYQYKKNKKEIERQIVSIQRKREWLYSLYFLDGEANDNFTYINASGRWKIANKTLGTTHTLKVTSVGHGKALIGVYVKWFNERYKAEIEQRRKEREAKNEKDKKAVKRLGAKLEKQKRDERIFKLYESGITNAAEIARRVGKFRGKNMSDRTVRDILNKYIKAKASPKSIPTQEELQQQEAERQEENRLMRLRFEQAHAQIEGKQKKWFRDQYNRKLRSLHNIGQNPSQISKTILNTPEEIARDLAKLKITPHFDFNLLTKKEQAAYRKKKREEEGEDPLELLDI